MPLCLVQMVGLSANHARNKWEIFVPHQPQRASDYGSCTSGCLQSVTAAPVVVLSQ